MSDKIVKHGEVVSLLPNAQFRVLLDKKNPEADDEEEEPIIKWAQISGRLRHKKINIIIGDRVEVSFSVHDFNKGVITYRGERKDKKQAISKPKYDNRKNDKNRHSERYIS